ncbi:FAD-binding domain-containing protein [Cadophora sp. DSE1049]|nr:FAD-binding domain-containing protein [Cadophora sp. DSE1049]
MMVFSLKGGVLLGFLAVGVVQAQLDTQIPIGTFQGNNSDACHDACTALASTLGEKVHHSTSLPSSLFSGYYTLMARSTIPLCIVHPTSSEDVSKAIKIISQHTCIFAIKSGGHAMFPGGSTAPGGIVLDLQLLNGLELSEDRGTLFLGTGNRWGAVYEFLMPWNLTVVGGRVGDVGVGGFLLGGGISFISRRYGWGCDNVRNYEIVLANGTITNISYASNPDLYFALRGGGKNFGIVTRFDLETHPNLPSWWGACKLGYCIDLDTFVAAISRLPIESENDHDAMGYGIFSSIPKANIYVVGTHTIHTGAINNAPSFTKLVSDLNTKSIHSTIRTQDPYGFTQELDAHNPVGVRVTYNTATFKVDQAFMKEVAKIYMQEVESIRGLEGFLGAYTTQTLARDEIAQFQKNGGNAFGIREEDGPLTILLVSFSWGSSKDDELVVRTAQNIIDRSVIIGKEMGVHHPFIYQNYAAKSQDVFAGYSVENQERLRRIQKEVDPEGVFVRLQPGYFSL